MRLIRTARVAKLPETRRREFLGKGETLIVFDCKRYAAEVNAAKARAHARELAMANNRRLLAKGAIGGNEVRVSEADFEEARATMQALQARTGSCEFRAPFDGRVVERIVQEQESPAPNQPLIRIVDMTRLEVETIIPSKWLARVKPGDAFTFTVDETEMLAAEVVRMGATVDAASQTIKAYGVLNAWPFRTARHEWDERSVPPAVEAGCARSLPSKGGLSNMNSPYRAHPASQSSRSPPERPFPFRRVRAGHMPHRIQPHLPRRHTRMRPRGSSN